MRRFLAISTLVLFAVAVAGCGEFGKKYDGSSDSTAKAAAQGSEKRITDEKFNDDTRTADGCTDIMEFDSEGSTHTTDPKEKVDYKHNPPMSGDHYEVPADWGLYDTEQRDTETVHNLEHGHILITYKGLTDKQRNTLLDQVRVNPFHLIVEPRKENPKDGVYYTAWTAQIFCERPSEVALQYMIDNWRDQGPELYTEDPGGNQMGSKQKK
ncbi:MAG: DUF3105 domain-containing protein [Thermoleophilia bacterium]|nr:DUF3105 domain-containing protein [Thermoleophilia bacterium]